MIIPTQPPPERQPATRRGPRTMQGSIALTPQGPRNSRLDVTWSDCIIDDAIALSGDHGLGLRFRNVLAGPEQALVESFLQAARVRLPPGRRLIVFAQPALETGFPDLVAVVWRDNVAQGWAPERHRLRAVDLRLLHLLTTSGPMDEGTLHGIFPRGLLSMLSRLEEADLLAIRNSICRVRSLSRIFAVERIIAIEAKIASPQRALQQASANSWFSSESHALFPLPRSHDRLRDAASLLGIGVIGLTPDRATQLCNAAVRQVPLSYGSWLFNEWTWRITQAVARELESGSEGANRGR